MQIEFVQCNTEVAMETRVSSRFEHQMKKMADCRVALSNQKIVEQLERKCEKQKHVETYTDLVECKCNFVE